MILKPSLEIAVYLDKDLMLDWSKWTAPSKNYLLYLHKIAKIRILDFLQSYVNKVDSFHKWADEQLKKYHENDLKEFRLLQDQFKKKLDGDI